jgi:type I restriction enzyme S subunit
MNRGLPKPGDLLFTTEAPLGMVAFFPEDGKYAVAQRLVTLRAKRGVLDSKYLLYYLLSEQGNHEVQLRSTGSTATGIRQSELRKVPIVLPPFPEQCKIAEILSSWEQAIALTERRIEAARQRKKGLMQRLLTGRVRFPEFVRSSKRRETKYGDLPVDWKYVPIGKVAREVSVKNEQDHDYPVLSCTKHYGLVNSLEYFGRQIYSDDLSTYRIVKRNQFAYATNHIEEGSIGYQDLHDFALISPMYTVFEASDRVDDGFLYKVLKTERYRHIFEVNTNGTVNRRGSLRWKVFATIRIPLPSLEEQWRIAAVLQACDREIELLTQKRDALQRQKKGLMQRLLTGRVRVEV